MHYNRITARLPSNVTELLRNSTTERSEIKINGCVEPFSYCGGTVQHAMSVEILSAAAKLYEKSHLKSFAIGESP